ncbi:MAG: hypothetical protein GY835_09320 [bacterium]|nr:hypothetical protein [bacterium]
MRSRRRIKPKALKKLARAGQSDIPRLMDAIFGPGNWFLEEAESLYIGKDPKYRGKGFGFYAVRPDGSWFRGVVPEGMYTVESPGPDGWLH